VGHWRLDPKGRRCVGEAPATWGLETFIFPILLSRGSRTHAGHSYATRSPSWPTRYQCSAPRPSAKR